MLLSELTELHYITPIENVKSILTLGILSNNNAKRVNHESCALQEIQERREKVTVPNGEPLHNYVNLYFHARNPMMYKIRETHRELVVLCINPDILNLPNVIITDRNASRDLVLFEPSPKGLEMIDKDIVFAESWMHDDPIKVHDHKGRKCAEVLVLGKIEAKYIMKAYVSCDENINVLISLLKFVTINIEENRHLFFQ